MFGRWFGRDDTPEIRSGKLVLRAPVRGDFQAWHDVRLESRDFLRPYEPRWSETDLNMAVFQARLQRGRREARAGTGFSFFIFVEEDGQLRLAGGITLSSIKRRAAQYVILGYWMSQKDANKGIMTRAVGAILPFVFDTLGLHRIHAACLPENLASRKVLEKNGFKQEGFAEHYLQIDGKWRDHVLFGLTREQYRQGPG